MDTPIQVICSILVAWTGSETITNKLTNNVVTIEPYPNWVFFDTQTCYR